MRMRSAGVWFVLLLGFFGSVWSSMKGWSLASYIFPYGSIGLVAAFALHNARRSKRQVALNSEGVALMGEGRHVEALSRFDAIQQRTREWSP